MGLGLHLLINQNSGPIRFMGTNIDSESNEIEPKATTLFIKHMVCPSCIYIVKTELKLLQIPISDIRLGEVDIVRPLDGEEILKVRIALKKFGFELIQDQKSKTIDQIKRIVIEVIRNQKATTNLKFSEYLSKEIAKDYSTLSALFSASEHITIEKYVILQKIEYVKELLTYDELSLSQIANALTYSDVGYLSRQFKKVTGLTPSEYKKQKNYDRKTLNNITGNESFKSNP